MGMLDEMVAEVGPLMGQTSGETTGTSNSSVLPNLVICLNFVDIIVGLGFRN